MWLLGFNGPSGFSARSTAEQVTKGIDGTGLTAIVTGLLPFFLYTRLRNQNSEIVGLVLCFFYGHISFFLFL